MFIYLDNAATTAPDKTILERAVKEYEEEYFNPSALYREGRNAKNTIDSARENILSFFKGRKLVFTSCGTESDNTAIFSFARRGNVVTTEGEHSAVYKSFEYLKQKGIEVRYAKLVDGGAVDVEDLLKKTDRNTCFCSVVHVNNETGAINDVNHIAKKVKEINPRIVFHTDAVQSCLKIPYSFCSEIDLISISAHKVKALKGVGALIYNADLHINPLIIGGGQEGGIRSGTENVLGIKVLGDCFLKYAPETQKNFDMISDVRRAFIEKLDKSLFKIISPDFSSPYVLSLSAPKLRGEVIQTVMDDLGIIIGKGSACSSKAPHSRVLKTFIRDNAVLDGAIRISFIFDTKKDDALKAAEILNQTVKKLYEKIVI
ncbi:MAG: aminotransferase class V-fold PLP-dependent enzyme [Clostridia bacterium]|nr:aminotransferase class V-fold PLP-dependent enzyme [Clostridia bacterium]